MPASLRVAADVGGTFTDIACLSSEGELSTCKLPSTPHDYALAVIEGIELLMRSIGAQPADFVEVSHASTVATNIILEAKGARTALVTTAGFRDVLELRRIRVPRLYEPLYQKPLPLVARRHRFEVAERLDARGEVVVPMQDAEIDALAVTLADLHIESVAVSLLHSYVNPAHEQRIGARLSAALPGCFVSLSSEVLPEIREYERTSTTVVNAYVGPTVSTYLRSLEQRLQRHGIAGRLVMMQSSGGTIDVAQVIAKPALVVESGPAAGVVGAARLGLRAGHDNIITFDMGGTTAKASLIDGGEILATDEYEVGGGISMSGGLAKGGGYALKLPVIDVSEVGAGGGSIVRIDGGNALKVGPESAGAVPGPACYAKGGTQATVTDANVFLGYLNPRGLAGGTVPIDAALAAAALQPIANRLNLSLLDTAHGIHRLANAAMARAVKAVSTHRGRDPREFRLFAFGGNGGIHAASLARDLQIQRVLVPPAAGVFSAVGLLCADREALCSAAFLRPVDAQSVQQALERCAELERLARADLGAADPAQRIRRRAAMRYAGQGFELAIDLPQRGADPGDLVPQIRAAFEREYRRTYGHVLQAHRLEFVALRVQVSVSPAGATTVNRVRPTPHQLYRDTSRPAYFGKPHGVIDTPVLGRDQLGPEARQGPLIIEEYEGTTVIPPRASAARDSGGNIVVTLIADPAYVL